MATGGSVPQFASLYVGDLHPDVTEAILYEIFNSVGPVGSIRICRDSVSRRSLGYGYVNFHSVADAERALDTLNYSSIKGRACRIMWSQRDPSLRKSGLGNIFVKNLDTNIDNKALYDTFSLFGNILSCKVACEFTSGKSRGYGFVHYETEEAAKQAIERVNGMQIGDKTVEVHSFLKKDDRSGNYVFTNLYVKNVPDNFDEDMLKEWFNPHGNVTSFVIREDAAGRKYCFVNYEEPEGAEKAIEAWNGKDMRTEEQKAKTPEDAEPETYLVYVGKAQNKAERIQEWKAKNTQAAPTGRPTGVNLYIKNLDENTTDESLKELFEPYGTITSCVANKDEKDKCKGFGFVCYSNPDEATKAVTEMHLKVVKGKPLYVGLAEKKDVRQERLRQRYQPGGAPMGPMGGKGGKGGKDGKGGAVGQMGQGGAMMGAQQGPMGPMGGGVMPQMMGGMKGGGMMGGPMQMMGGKGGMMGPGGGKGPMMGMMGPQMMGMRPGMMPPQMMGMMGGKGGMVGGMPPMGMMRPMMPVMQGQRGPTPQQQPQQPQQRPPQAAQGGPLNATALASAPPGVQKQMLGEKIYPAISKYQPELAGKITGMMLEMDNSELLMLLESESQLKAKVDEAMRVLEGTSRPA